PPTNGNSVPVFLNMSAGPETDALFRIAFATSSSGETTLSSSRSSPALRRASRNSRKSWYGIVGDVSWPPAVGSRLLTLSLLLTGPSFDQASIQTEQIKHPTHGMVHDVGHGCR